MALDQQHQQFDIGLQRPLCQFTATSLIQKQQPAEQPSIIQPMFLPAIQIHHILELLGRSQREQPNGIGQADLFQSIEKGFRRQHSGEIEALARSQDQLLTCLGR